MTEVFLSLPPCGKCESKRPQTEVESVTVHRGCSPAKPLSGGKTASPTKLHVTKTGSVQLQLVREGATLQLHNTEVGKEHVYLLAIAPF